MNELENDLKEAEKAEQEAFQKAKELRERRSVSIFNYLMEKLEGKTWHLHSDPCCGLGLTVKSKFIDAPYEGSLGNKRGVELSWIGEGYRLGSSDPEAFFMIVEEHNVHIATSALGNLITRSLYRPLKIKIKHVICGKCGEEMVYAANCSNGRMYRCRTCDMKVEVETIPACIKED